MQTGTQMFLTHSQDAWHCHTGHSEMMERWRGSGPLSLADFSRFVRFTSRGVTWVCKVQVCLLATSFHGDVAISSIWRSPPCCQGGLFHFTFHAALTVWRKSKIVGHTPYAPLVCSLCYVHALPKPCGVEQVTVFAIVFACKS